jgi:phosphatidylglycerol---prolipoprotein diacylglyceryl transferase
MHPVICKIGPFTVYSFGLMFLLAVILCSWLLGREAKRYGIPSEEIQDLIFWLVLSGVLGARLFFIFLNFFFFWENPGEIFMLNRGGLAWQGGLLAGIVAGIIFSRRKRKSLWFLADLLAPYLALGQAIGRLGCFLNGCCYGRPVSWGVYFPVHQAFLYPTQLYEAAALAVAFFILQSSKRSLPYQGQVFSAYLVLASLARFLNEFFRADHTAFIGGLSIFQVVCIALGLSGVTLFMVFQRSGIKRPLPSLDR